MDRGREVAFGPLRIARLKPSFIPSSAAHPHESRSGREPGPADRARRRAVAIPGSPPDRWPETLVGEEFVHGADLGVVAGEGEFGQAPRVLDGPQHGVVVVGDVADEVVWPAGIDYDRGHQRAAVQATRPAGADVRVTLGQHG